MVCRTGTLFVKRWGPEHINKSNIFENMCEILVPQLLFRHEPKGVRYQARKTNVGGTVTENCLILMLTVINRSLGYVNTII